MKDIEFAVGQTVHKPHPEFKSIFVKMKVTDIKINFHGEISYSLKSKEDNFPWTTNSGPEFIKESKYFLVGLDLIDKEYEYWLYTIGGQA